MRILVTGATGFVGRHLVPLLLKRGHEVISLVRDATKGKSLPWLIDTSLVEHDISARTQNVTQLTGPLDAVIHLAWPGLPNYRDHDHFNKHLPATYHFLKDLVTSGCKRVLVTGTCFEYGHQCGCLGENLLTNPTNPYGIAKDGLRRYLQVLQADFDFQLCWARLFYVHGIGQNPRSLTSLLQAAIDSSKLSFPMTGGEQLRDFIEIELAALYLANLIELPQDVGIVNICSGVPTSVRTFVETWLIRHQQTIELELGAVPYSENEPFAFWGSAEKLRRLIPNNES